MQEYAIFLTFDDGKDGYFQRMDDYGTLFYTRYIDDAKWFRGYNAAEAFIDNLYNRRKNIIYAEPVKVVRK